MCQHPRGLLPRAPQALQVFFTSSRVLSMLFKARVALSGSTDYINSHCACVQTYRDVLAAVTTGPQLLLWCSLLRNHATRSIALLLPMRSSNC